MEKNQIMAFGQVGKGVGIPRSEASGDFQEQNLSRTVLSVVFAVGPACVMIFFFSW